MMSLATFVSSNFPYLLLVAAYLAIVERREHHAELELAPFQPRPEVTRSLPRLLFFLVPRLEAACI